MSTKRINAATAFSWQIVQACLQHNTIPSAYKGMMMHLAMSMGDDTHYATASVLVRVHGAPSQVHAHVTMTRHSTDGPWLSGACDLHILGDETRTWNFTANVVDNRIEVQLSGHPGLDKAEYTYAHPSNGAHQHD